MSKKMLSIIMLICFFAGALSYRQVIIGENINVKSTYRKISSIRNEASMSQKSQELIQEMIRVKTHQDVDAFISKHVQVIDTHLKAKSINELPRDYRLMLSLIYPFKRLRGFGYQIYGFSEIPLQDRKYTNVNYSMGTVKSILDAKLQSIISNINVYSPKFGSALFDWLTLPSSSKTSFNRVEDVQNFLMGSVYPDFKISMNLIGSIGDIPLNRPLLLDLAAITGSKKAIPERQRLLHVYQHEIEALKALMSQTCHDLIIYAHYDRNDSINYEYNLKKKLIMNGYKLSSSPGIPMYLAVNEFKSYPKLLTLRSIPFSIPGGEESWMMVALKHLRSAIYHENLSYQAMKTAVSELTDDEITKSILNPRLHYLVDERVKKSFAKRQLMTSQNGVALKSFITGEMTRVNMVEMYQNPPMDLKAFLPTEFELSQPRQIQVNGKKVTNYRFGLPSNWDLAIYQTYFPTVKNAEDIKKLARILESHGATSMLARLVNRFMTIDADYKAISLGSI
jgi:hypothetical protein